MQARMGGFFGGVFGVAALVAACGHDSFDAGRPCAAGDARPCYTGAAGTEGVGACQAGEQTCLADESGWGACEGEVTPRAETCLSAKPEDEDCDGQVNEEGEGCTCEPETTEACYPGPAETEGVGICAAGVHACEASGVWGACTGAIVPAEEDCENLEDDDCDGVVCAGPLWAELFGIADAQTVAGIASDAQGNAFLVGSFNGAIDFGTGLLQTNGATDVFVAKLDGMGKAVWAARFGGAGVDNGVAIAVDGNGDVLIAGLFASDPFQVGATTLHAKAIDGFAAKLDGATGAALWARKFGDSGNSAATGVAVDASGNVFVGGWFSGDFLCAPQCIASNGGTDGFLYKLGGDDGVADWMKLFGGAGNDRVDAVSADSAGNVVAAGTFSATASWGAITLSTTGVNDADFYIVKLSSDGSAVAWARDFGDSATQQATGVAVDSQGNVAVTGQMTGTVQYGGVSFGAASDSAFVAQVSAGGALLWGRTFAAADEPGGSITSSTSIAIDAEGHIAVAGQFAGAIDCGAGTRQAVGTSDAFLAKLDTSGAYLWSKTLGATGAANVARAVAFTPSGKVLLGTDVNGAIDFGLGGLTASGHPDVGAAAFAP